MPPKEEEEFLEGKMTDRQKYACCQNYRDVNQDKIFMAERRTCELADAFTTLEVQIAVVLFGLVGIFSSFAKVDGASVLLSGGMGMKISYIAVFVLLIISLAFGLIHIKRRESFWESHMSMRISRHNKWDEAIKRRTTYEEAMAFHHGTANNRMDVISKSPDWTWILQTICLSLAVIILLILFTIFLFSN